MAKLTKRAKAILEKVEADKSGIALVMEDKYNG